MESLFVLYALHLESSGQDELSQSPLLFYSSIDQVEAAAAEYHKCYSFLYDGGLFSKELYCLIVEEYRLNEMYPSKLSISVYHPTGRLIERTELSEGKCICNPLGNTRSFRVGDIVESPCGEHLYLGIVAEVPALNALNESGQEAMEDSYTLIVYPSMELEYVYAPLLFKPRGKVARYTRDSLRDALERYQKNMTD